MEEVAQACAYANADFHEPHNRFIQLCQARFPGETFAGPVLDLGCGPGDIMFRFATAYPAAHVVGIDGSAVMLDYGRQALLKCPELLGRIEFVYGCLPNTPLPSLAYRAIISNSLLHHLPYPEVLWQTICQYAQPSCAIYIMDLLRPETETEARRTVDENAAGEPEVLRRDFYNSLLAAFSLEEVQAQLQAAGLNYLALEQVSERHWLVHGRKRA